MGQYDYASTKNDIMSRALRMVGAMTLGDTLTAEMSDVASQALNEMVQAWQNDNIHIWRLTEITFTMVIGQKSYTTPTGIPIVGIDSAYMRVNGGDTPIQILSMRQYEEIVTKDAAGQPDSLVLVPTDPPTITVWPVPTATDTIAALAIQKLPDFDATSDTGSFSSRWSECLAYNLAARLCDEFPIPLTERQYLTAKAANTLKIARLGNNEQPTDDFVKGAFD